VSSQPMETEWCPVRMVRAGRSNWLETTMTQRERSPTPAQQRAASAPSPKVFLRFKDLKLRGIVSSRTQLDRMFALGFPPGALLSSNIRAWVESEVYAWIASRPTKLKEISPLARKPVKPKTAAVAKRRRGRPAADHAATAQVSK
jgi:predicted DNA-binding transcriptional regulator AlpA